MLNPGNVENGYLFNTGWATNSNIETPNSKTVWKIDGNSKLTPTSPVKIYFENSQGIRFERKISLDKKYLFNIEQKIINNSNNSYKFFPYAFLHFPKVAWPFRGTFTTLIVSLLLWNDFCTIDPEMIGIP